jgi:hypothetical protein
MTKGIIYTSTKHGFYARQAFLSAVTAKRVMQVPITLFTDNVGYIKRLEGKYKEKPFDHVKEAPVVQDELTGLPFLQRIKVFSMSPYERTLAIDVDTAFSEDISHVFRMLDQFDLCVCHDDYRHFSDHLYPNKIPRPMPLCFSNICGGILFYKNNHRTSALFQQYERLYVRWYKRFNIKLDQLALRHLLWKQIDLRYYILPPEYNVCPRLRKSIRNHRIYHFINSVYFDIESGPLQEPWFREMVKELKICGKSSRLRRKRINGGYEDD